MLVDRNAPPFSIVGEFHRIGRSVLRSEIDKPVGDRGRDHRGSININRRNRFALAHINNVEFLITAGNETEIVVNRWRREDLVTRFIKPFQLACISMDAVELLVFGTKDDILLIKVGGRSDLSVSLEFPDQLTFVIQAIKSAIQVTDENPFLVHRRRRHENAARSVTPVGFTG